MTETPDSEPSLQSSVFRPIWAKPMGCLIFGIWLMGVIAASVIGGYLIIIFISSAASMIFRRIELTALFSMCLSAACLCGTLTLIPHGRRISCACTCILLFISVVMLALPSSTTGLLSIAVIGALVYIGGCYLLKAMFNTGDRLTDRRFWRKRNLKHQRCPSCGYDIRALPLPRCPECGEKWSPEEIELSSANEQA